jgi:hypothetical protein
MRLLLVAVSLLFQAATIPTQTAPASGAGRATTALRLRASASSDAATLVVIPPGSTVTVGTCEAVTQAII